MKRIIRFGKNLFCLVIFVYASSSTIAQLDTANNLSNFLLPRFTKSIIKFKSGQSKTAVINYNVVDQEMVFLQNDIYMVLEDPQQIEVVYIDDRKFVPFKTGFYELVVSGPSSLYIQHKSIVEYLGTPTGYGATTKTSEPSYVRQIYGNMGSINLRIPDDFKVTENSEYWIEKENKMEKFSGKRQFLKIFNNKEKEINQFIDRNNINFKKNADIINLVNYCNLLSTLNK